MIASYPPVAPGQHDDMYSVVSAIIAAGAMRVTFRAAAVEYEQWTQLYVDGWPAGTPVFASSTRDNVLSGLLDATDKHWFSLCPLGNWYPQNVDVSAQDEYWFATYINKIRVRIVNKPTLESHGDAGQFSAWSLTGLSRFQNCAPFSPMPTWGIFDLDMAT